MDKLIYGVLVSATILNGQPSNIEHTADAVVEEIIIPSDINGWQKFTDPLFEKIGYCESYDRVLGKNNLLANNPNSTADGEFQFLNGTWKYHGQKLWGEDWVNKNKYSTDNRELAWYVYTHFGTSDWEADPKSYNCWKDEIPNAVYKNII